MKTYAEYRWYLWLRRELKAELGVPLRNGRPRALSRADELRVFREVTSTRRYCRGGVYLRLARELGIGVSTLQATTATQRIIDGLGRNQAAQ